MAIQLLPLLLFGGAAAAVLSGKKKPKKSKITRGPSSNCMKLSDIQSGLKGHINPLPIHLLPQIESAWKRFQGPATAQGLIKIDSTNKRVFDPAAIAVFADAIMNELGCRSVVTGAGQPLSDVSYVEYRLFAAVIGCAEAYLLKKTFDADDSAPPMRGAGDPLLFAVRHSYSAPTNESDVAAGVKADYAKVLLPENPQSFDDFMKPTSELERRFEDHTRRTFYQNGLGGKDSGSDEMDVWELIAAQIQLEEAKLDEFMDYVKAESAAAYCALRANAMPGYETLNMMSDMASRSISDFILSEPDGIMGHESFSGAIGPQDLHPVIVARFDTTDICFVRCSNARMKSVSDYFDALKNKGYFQDEERGASLLLLMTSEGPGPDLVEDYLEWWDDLPPEVKMIFDSAPNSGARQEALTLLQMRHPALHKLYNLMVDTVIGYNEGWLEFK